MAIGVPSVPRILPFDATKEMTIEYYYTGSPQREIEIVVENNTSGAVVYTGIQTTMRTRYVIPAGALANGVAYRAKFRVRDGFGGIGNFSNLIIFHCFSTPTFKVENITSGARLSASQHDVAVRYQQAENEVLDTYIITLYDDLGARILDSGTLFWHPDASNVNLNVYRLNGLVDNGLYHLSLSGTTRNGMVVSSEQIAFSVEYVKTVQFSVTELVELPDSASVKIQSNAFVSNGRVEPAGAEPVFIDGSAIDMNNGSYSVKFDEDVLFGNAPNSDFYVRTILSHIDLLTFQDCFLVLANADDSKKVSLYKRTGRMYDPTIPDKNVEEFYVELISTDPISYTPTIGLGAGIKQVANYVTHSNELPLVGGKLPAGQELVVNLLKIDGLYSVTIDLK